MMKSKIDHEREPEIRKLFDREGREITREEGIALAMNNRGEEIAGHKLILSPGDNSIDMVEYTRDQMKVLEERFNARIDYSFSYQKNTDHYHIHVNLPGVAERNFDFGSEPMNEKVEIRLDRSDFAAMREAGNKYLSNYTFTDHLTDRRVADDLLRDWFGKDERSKQYSYDKQARSELGLELSVADMDALRELGLDMPDRRPEEAPRKKRFKESDDRQLGGKEFGDEFAKYLSDKERPFEDEWSDRDVARILETSERDPEWVFSNAYKAQKRERKDRLEAIENVSTDERFKQFTRSVETAIALERAESFAERLRLGIGKAEYSSDQRELDAFFKNEGGEQIYEKFLEVQKSVEAKDGRDQALFSDLHHSMDLNLAEHIERLSEKFNLKLSENLEGRSSTERGEEALDAMKGRADSLKNIAKTLNYKSSGNFTDSFERLIRLDEGSESMPKFENADMRAQFLAEKLMQPEYAEQRQHLDKLKQRAFHLYSSYATREDVSETKQVIRDSQFALDTKVLDLTQERILNQERQRGIEGIDRDANDAGARTQTRHEINAEAHAEKYRQALEKGNEREASDAAQKFHASVIKIDDERLRDEFALNPDYGPPREREMPTGDMRQSIDVDDSRQEHDLEPELPEYPGGPYLPLPGYGLERLTRESGEEFTADPSEIQVELTYDEFRRRYEDDEHDRDDRSR